MNSPSNAIDNTLASTPDSTATPSTTGIPSSSILSSIPSSIAAPTAPLTEQTLPIADIHLPHAVSAWPPAIGWWLLAVLMIAAIAGIIYGRKRYQKKWRYRRAALALLQQHFSAYQTEEASSADTATAMIAVIKRTAITAYAVEHATLFGQKWIDFLNQQTKENHFSDDVADWIINRQYQHTNNENDPHQPQIDIAALYRACQLWIKQHHSQLTPSAHQDKPTTEKTEQKPLGDTA